MITKQQMIDLCLVRSNKEWGTIDGQILLAIATFLKEIDQEPVAKHKQEIMQEFTDVDEDRIGQLIKRKVELIERKTVLRLSVTESLLPRTPFNHTKILWIGLFFWEIRVSLKQEPN